MKNVALFSACLFLAPAVLAQSARSDIQIRKLEDNRFELVLTSYQSATVEAGQRELLGAANIACRDKFARFAKYSFDLSEPISANASEKRVLRLKQEIICEQQAAQPAEQPAAAPSKPDKPGIEQDQMIERLTYTYLAAKDSQKYREAYALFSPTQQTAVAFDSWAASTGQFNAKAGKVLSRRVKKITWYTNPPGVTPGLYAAADYSGTFENVDINCGFVAWQKQADGSFLVTREEQNSIDNETLKKVPPGDLARIRAQFGC